MSDGSRSGQVGCGKILGYGCLGVVVLGVVVGVGLWAGWDLLRGSGFGKGIAGSIETVKEEGVALQAMRERLLADFPAADVQPFVQIQNRDGVTVKTLQITLVDPRFELAASDEERFAQARDIARAAAAAHPGIRRYDQLRLIVVRTVREGAATTSTSTSTWEFPTSEL
jgi:hypothetical protein